jgi:hypothetical protein
MALVPLVLLFLLAPTPSLASILAEQLLYLQTGEASPSSVACGSSASSLPTALIAQWHDAPIGLRAYNASAAPLWSFYPGDTDSDTLYQVYGCSACASGAAVDAAVLRYSSAAATPQSNCTLFGLSSTAARWAPAWTKFLPSCAAGTPSGGGIGPAHHAALAPSGGTLAAQLLLNGECTLLALDAATGTELWRAPCRGGGLGVSFSADGRWVLATSSPSSSAAAHVFVFSAATGAQRGGSGCPLGWDSPPALSPAAEYIITPAQNAVWVCVWSEEKGLYGDPLSVNLEAWGEEYWFPSDTAVIEAGGRVLAGTVFAASQQLNVGRMFAFDVGAAAASGGSAASTVVDALLNDFRNTTSHGGGLGSIVGAGPYWFVGMLSGGDGALPTEFLFIPGGTGAPWGTPVWFNDGAGSVTSIDARLVESNADFDVVHVLAGGTASSGGDGCGGQVYWHSISNSK